MFQIVVFGVMFEFLVYIVDVRLVKTVFKLENTTKSFPVFEIGKPG